MRLFIAAAVALALALPAVASDDRAPKLLAMMSASDLVRAIKCAIPGVCEVPAKQKPGAPRPSKSNRRAQ